MGFVTAGKSDALTANGNEKTAVVYLLTALVGALLWFLGEVESDFVATERQS